jgi:negative regulator of sigma E activity
VSIDHRTLMQYFDGELADEQAAEIEALLETDAEARRVLEGIEQVGAVVRGVMLDRAGAADDLTDAVMARISASPAEGRRPHTGQSARPAARRLERGRLRALAERPQVRRAVPVALVTLAAAAAVALLFERANPRPPRVTQPSQPVTAVATHRPPAVPLPSQEPELELASADSVPAIAIETVDFGSREGTIFMLAEGEMATPVVWLMDEPGAGHDTMEPL